MRIVMVRGEGDWQDFESKEFITNAKLVEAVKNYLYDLNNGLKVINYVVKLD